VFQDENHDSGSPPSLPASRPETFGGFKPFQAVNVCNHLVSGSFHTPLGVLFSFPSPYWCTIGLRTYLALEVNSSQLPAPYPRRSTQELRPNSRRPTSTGLSPIFVGLSRPLRLRRQRGGPVLNPTSHAPFDARFGLGFSLFTRRYSGNLG
jgi:hypothetical protein